MREINLNSTKVTKILVNEENSEKSPTTMPLQSNGVMLIRTLQSEFPSANGLKFAPDFTKPKEYEVLRFNNAKIFSDGQWRRDVTYIVKYPKKQTSIPQSGKLKLIRVCSGSDLNPV
jgi:hypothetical protein